MDRYVLDTSALMAVLKHEPGHQRVLDLLALARDKATEIRLLLPFMAVFELEYLGRRLVSRKLFEDTFFLMGAAPVDVIESHPAWLQRAAELKANGGLSVADAWIASLALLEDATLVHKDREYDAVSGLKALRLAD